MLALLFTSDTPEISYYPIVFIGQNSIVFPFIAEVSTMSSRL